MAALCLAAEMAEKKPISDEEWRKLSCASMCVSLFEMSLTPFSFSLTSKRKSESIVRMACSFAGHLATFIGCE